MGTTYELLKGKIKKLECVVAAVDLESPLTASHLLVAACVEAKKLVGILTSLRLESSRCLLAWGYGCKVPVAGLFSDVSACVRRLDNDSDVYYDAYQLPRDIDGCYELVNSAQVEDEIAEAKESVAQMIREERTVLGSLSKWDVDNRNNFFPGDVKSYHEDIYGMICLLADLVDVCMERAKGVDADIANPSVEMVAYWMEDVFETFRKEKMGDSLIKKLFETERKKASLKRHGRSKECELDFLEKELESFSKGCGDSLLEFALVRHYDEVTGECDFEEAARDVLPYWDSVKDEGSECLEDYAENLMMIRYVRDEIARISGEQKAEDEPKVNKGAKGGLKKSFADSVINGDADEVLVFLRNELEGKSTQKDVMMVFRAVKDAGLTRKPTFKEFECDFASVVKVKINKSNFDKYLKKDFKFDESAFEYLVEKAKKLR